MILGPNGGTTNFPAVEQGPAGLTPTFTVTTNQVASGTVLPSPNPAVTVTPGSGSTPPNYALTFYINAGATGASGTTTIMTATDLEGTAQALYMIGYDAANARPQWQPKPVGNYYFTNSVPATSSNTNVVKPLASIAIAPYPFSWWPEVSGQINVIGAVDTRVDLVARINSTGGTICGYGYGAAGNAPPPTSVGPWGLAVGGNSIIPSGTGATIFFNAENQTSSANPWNTTSSAFFQVKVAPVPS
jgi:hypothetical protein